ncbi:nitroreductase family protein [Meira miltonrushii]|uniref:Nitroreductase family protein n=1 Tax=Meira miltonrushii TaxID=1280837 RepID=A0A316V8G7_9BASI|nr:nitroreductase family protein [Meira miltonrushii]PWN33318.1 nitroreductase family protein [Meira miltonrushii]
MSRSLAKAQEFIAQISSRRSIYALGRRSILNDKDLTDLIKKSVRESPTSFNSQTSRVVILLGDQHERYWNEIAVPALRKAVGDDDAAFEKGSQRMTQFRDAYGTALFYEDQDAIKEMQKKVAIYADRFPEWSIQSSGMAQINTWSALSLAGYGANLQHYGNLTQKPLAEAFGIPANWQLYSELVFGSPENEAGEKTYMDDADRFKVFGSQ